VALAITDVHETRARLDLANSQEIAALNDVEIKRQGLRRITGLPPMALLSLKSDLSPLQPEPNNIDLWVAKADELNPQVQAQRLTLEVAERKSRRRWRASPTVDAVANTMNNSTGVAVVSPNVKATSSKSASVSIPIYRARLAPREREAVALREKAREELIDARRLVALQTRQAFLTVGNSLSQIIAMEQAVASSSSLLDATRDSAKVGLKTRTDVLNAEQQLFGAKRDLARARYSYLLGMLQLKASAGTLVEGTSRPPIACWRE
jgi:outer membrane protein